MVDRGRATAAAVRVPDTDQTAEWLESAVYNALRDFQQTAGWPQLRLAQMRQHLAEHIARDIRFTPGNPFTAPVPLPGPTATAEDVARALDNATPYPIELDRALCRFMAARLLEMLTIGKRPDHDVWQPEEEPEPGVQPQPEDPATLARPATGPVAAAAPATED
jgi:hypothetical protein